MVHVARVDAQAQQRLAQLADRVAADLRYAGCEVTSLGDSALDASREHGVLVFIDPSSGPDGGVYVSWKPSQDLLVHALDYQSGLHDQARLESNRAAQIGGTALDVMLRALGEILEASGWGVDAINATIHESSVRVFMKKEPGSRRSR
jgi:hypothetical protein